MKTFFEFQNSYQSTILIMEVSDRLLKCDNPRKMLEKFFESIVSEIDDEDLRRKVCSCENVLMEGWFGDMMGTVGNKLAGVVNGVKQGWDRFTDGLTNHGKSGRDKVLATMEGLKKDLVAIGVREDVIKQAFDHILKYMPDPNQPTGGMANNMATNGDGFQYRGNSGMASGGNTATGQTPTEQPTTPVEQPTVPTRKRKFRGAVGKPTGSGMANNAASNNPSGGWRVPGT